jgi:type I restriction enzyme, S subunit
MVRPAVTIADLEPYPEYKESGLPWLGQVPGHWQPKRLKRLLRPVDHRSSTGAETLLSLRRDHGVVVYAHHFSRPAQGLTTVGFKLVRTGQLVVNRMQANNGLIFHSRLSGLVSPDYSVFEATVPLLMDYLSELLRVPLYRAHFRRESTGLGTGSAGFLRLYDDRFLNTIVETPSFHEQEAILRFLSWANGRLERAIRAKRKVIALLTEQKQAIIYRAVTRGLDPSATLKPSGIPWLGDIPQHWEVRRFKTSIGFQEGPGIMLADFCEAGVPLLRISCLAGSEATLNGCNYLSPAKVREKWDHFAVKPGDYLLSASGSTGAVRRASEEVVGAIPYTGIIRLWPRSAAVDMEYLRLFMSAKPFADQILMAKSGVGIEHFGPTHLKRMWICQPPVGEQREIVGAVGSATVGLDAAVSRLEREIDLLREYRTRLVADVVTGKLDVRETAARLPAGAPPDTAEDEPDTSQETEAPDEAATA